ncbi:MAG: 2-hydroxyacyl-CoA dehydratase [Deltaproteobacteria bacterium]|nr:2-hydroxyacyl-CoA dehydratase [Deltaproteobacteria bacterium]
MSDTIAGELKIAGEMNAYQRKWLANVRERVGNGEPFAICNGDEFEEIFNAMDIPVMVLNYWSKIIATEAKASYYKKVLKERGYDPLHLFFSLGLACAMDNNPETAPWGGLPKPSVIVGGSKHDREMKVLELWARECGCPFIPMEFGLNTTPEQPPLPPRWWERMRDHWDELIDPDRLNVRVEEEKSLIRFLEITTGKHFSPAKLDRVAELINEQMDYWGKVRDLIAATIPCPVSLPDQIAMYQAMWHRGTEMGCNFIKAYYEEIKERVEKGIFANPNEKLRLMYIPATTPAYAGFLEETYHASLVCFGYSSIPIDCYARTVHNNDALRTLASRHMVLFSETPDWRLKDAQLHQCDGVIEVIDPAMPSLNKPLFDASGMPLLSLYTDKDTRDIKSRLSRWIETTVLPNHKGVTL